MKKSSKYWVIAILIFSALLIILFNLYRSGVAQGFEHKTKLLDSSWSDVVALSNKRNVLLNSLASRIENKNATVDSLNRLIEKYHKHESFFRKKCSLDFVKLEFDLNRLYLDISEFYKKDTLFTKNEINILQKLEVNKKEANAAIDKYNQLALDYNKYLSVFPNFIFAKNYGYAKRKFFTIKYGFANEDPIIRNKELPEWAKGIDTL
jgi:hypothetical protein